MASQEFLASFAVEIDEGGVSRLRSVLEENRDLADEAAAAFEAAAAAIREYRDAAAGDTGGSREGYDDLISARDLIRKPLEQVRENAGTFGFGSPSGTREESGPAGDGSAGVSLDLANARADLESFREEAARPVELSGSAAGMVSAARSAWNRIRSLFSAPVTIRAVVETEAGEDGEDGEDPGTVKMSTGGRFSRPTDVQVAEDGDAEYIIPVKKEDRAVPLLRQLLSELSPAARESLAPGDAAAPLSGGIAAGTVAAPQLTQNNSNVSAPVTIQVHASGANAERIGRSVYDAAERYLLRTMKSVFTPP